MAIDLFTIGVECGCAAKIPAGQLKDALDKADLFTDENVIVGPDTLDDAGIYKIEQNRYLVQTVDFFPPVARTGIDYGRIAAANSLSDIYAMGGKPLTALAIVCFPTNTLGPEVLEDITKGALEKLREASCVLLGGHSVVDPQPKYGLSITGEVHPNQLMDNAHARPGDVLILTKPIGTGVTLMGLKADMVNPQQERTLYESMASLNLAASQIAAQASVRCCTDITGFGLLGHTMQLARASGVSIELSMKSIPKLDGIKQWAQMGLMSANTYANRDYVGDAVVFDDAVDQADRDLLFDPQTSGGLLAACPKNNVDRFMKQAETQISTQCEIIGTVVESSGESSIKVTP